VSDLVLDPLGAGAAALRSIEASGEAFAAAWRADAPNRDEIRAALLDDMVCHAGEEPARALAVMLEAARRLSGNVDDLGALTDVFVLHAVVEADPFVPSPEEEVVGHEGLNGATSGGAGLAISGGAPELGAPPPLAPPTLPVGGPLVVGGELVVAVPATELMRIAVELVQALAGGEVEGVPARLSWLSLLLAEAHDHFTWEHPEDLVTKDAELDADTVTRMLVEIEVLHDTLAHLYGRGLAALGLGPSRPATQASGVDAVAADLPLRVDRGLV